MLQIKERKEMDDLFKKAQKPWAKHLAKVEKTKADYHGACKTEKTVANQERNASADSSISGDQVCKWRVSERFNSHLLHYTEALNRRTKDNTFRR